MDEQALEAAAKAIYKSIGPLMGNDEPWENVSWHKRAQHAKEARAAITAYLEASGEAKDSKRLDYLETRFSCHWDGTIGRAPTWHLVGSIICGNTLREAIDTALEGK